MVQVHKRNKTKASDKLTSIVEIMPHCEHQNPWISVSKLSLFSREKTQSLDELGPELMR